LIISDDGSTDATQQICQEYAKKDERIRYIRQAKNMGLVWNIGFVLREARCPYFAWAAQDDLWHPDFLKKNLEVLESNNHIICSLGKIKRFATEKDYSLNKVERFFSKILFPRKYGYAIPISGSFKNKVRLYLSKLSDDMTYGLYRTSVLRESYVTDEYVGHGHAVNLNVLRHGDVNVIDEDLMLKYAKGSSRNLFYLGRKVYGNSRIKLFFLWLPFTLWCAKNLGCKIFLKNLDYFLLINYPGLTFHLAEFYLKYIKSVR
jgi:glycosyltransferase involved in cell wall biosynthesis